jgi:hypothetical protein
VWAIAGAVAVTVAAPGYSATVEQSAVEHWREGFGGTARALDFLVQASWIAGEAQERGLRVSNKTAADAVDQEPNHGLTRKDFVYFAKITLLEEKIHEQVTQPAAQSVTPAQVDAYVQAHPRTDPKRLHARVVMTKTPKQAREVERKIRNGLSWKVAARRYSLIGGSGPKTIERGDLDLNVENAFFRAPIRKLSRYRTYVFRIVRITPRRPTPLATQRAMAWEILASEAEHQALEQFQQAFEAKWKARTTCDEKYATTRVCQGTNPNPAR